MRLPRQKFDPCVAEKLKMLRLEKGLTVYTVGENFGLTASTISRYETADISPNKDTIERYGIFFNVSPLWILGMSDERTYTPKPYGAAVPLIGNYEPGVSIQNQADVLDTLFVSSALKPLFYWKMPDNSMTGARIQTNDMVCVSAFEGVENEKLYAVQYDGRLFVRRIIVARTSMVLHPENNSFDDIIVTLHEKHKVKIIGSVVSVAHWVG